MTYYLLVTSVDRKPDEQKVGVDQIILQCWKVVSFAIDWIRVLSERDLFMASLFGTRVENCWTLDRDFDFRFGTDTKKWKNKKVHFSYRWQQNNELFACHLKSSTACFLRKLTAIWTSSTTAGVNLFLLLVCHLSIQECSISFLEYVLFLDKAFWRVH